MCNSHTSHTSTHNTDKQQSQGSHTPPCINPVWTSVTQRKRGSGPWAGKDRKKQLLDHLKLKHPENGVLNLIFFWTKCRLEFINFITAGKHGRKCFWEANSISSSFGLALRSVWANSSIASGQHNLVHVVFPIPEIDGIKLILFYPGVPCRCPMWVTLLQPNAMLGTQWRTIGRQSILSGLRSIELIKMWIN